MNDSLFIWNQWWFVITAVQYSSNEKDILTYYFYAGYIYEAITKFLSNYHDASMGIKALKRRFSEYGFKKKTEYSQMM